MNVKKLGIVIGVLLLSIQSFSQAQIENGDKKLQAGFRFYGFNSGIMGTYDSGLTTWFSVGAGADFLFEGEENFFVYGRANLHLGNLLGMDSKFDIYPGIDVGATAEGFGLGARLGFRYFFSDSIGLFLEVGNQGAAGVCINL